MNQMNQTYAGEKQCDSFVKSSNKQCENFAYFYLPEKDQMLCGIHSRSVKNRQKLPKNPKKSTDRIQFNESWKQECDKIAQENSALGKIGRVECSKLKMMKLPTNIQGFVKVFPNFKHDNRKDGYGCKSLSPKAIGPIDHKQPNLPLSKNLENFHQFNKVFPWEVDENGEILECFFKAQTDAYNDEQPHRHKFSLNEIKKRKRDTNDKTNINTPLFSVHMTKDGQLKKFSYLESRFFYCHHYEMMATKLEQFLQLKDMKQKGYNLQIVGYDAYPLLKLNPDESDVEMFDRFYNDVSKPFGHELVLAALLILDDPLTYPWNRFFHLNFNVYQGCL